ncbi:sugar kinase [Teichococcus cervicalis]|uniref:Kinase, PfkB family n=1 Tax=Pseudoroseomonas cervicalis ATCC 49957 TaxID=525371 RepID=D5RPJ7_9PROT|nr:sugar kinase [Pseudoroseomonas cervicalis]EFH10792.1 kinase, PfkB family [Pseudoroseomonas cervicalis ATCC 49957]
MRRLDVLCLGEPMLEFNQLPPDENGRALYLEGHGGDTSNAAIAAARAGARAGYVSAIGRDAPGRSFLALWAAEGVDASTVAQREDAPTGIYFVTHGAQGHEFTFYRAGSAASRMAPADMPEDALKATRILHLSGISQAISASACDACFHAMELARAGGAMVSYDTNLRRALWPLPRARAVIHASLRMADIAFPSHDDAMALTGLEDPDAIADVYLAMVPQVILKLGRQGVMVATREGRTTLPGHSVKAVDATGAGDTFAGNFLARLSQGDSLEDAARYANAAAALATTGYGAVAPMPRPEAVRALLAN